MQQMLEENKVQLKNNKQTVTVQDSSALWIQKSGECNVNRNRNEWM